MKLLDYIEKLQIGEVVTNKRLLAVLKRKGLIFDYSFFGYLESCFIYYNEQYVDKTERWQRCCTFSRKEMRHETTSCVRMERKFLTVLYRLIVIVTSCTKPMDLTALLNTKETTLRCSILVAALVPIW